MPTSRRGNPARATPPSGPRPWPRRATGSPASATLRQAGAGGRASGRRAWPASEASARWRCR
eukprot:8907066-Alexandrium_andersonii.AAC.1